MLQNLEKEIDDVDAEIGDRWRLLDRFVHHFLEIFWVDRWWFQIQVTMKLACRCCKHIEISLD